MNTVKEKIIKILINISGTKKINKNLDMNLVENGYLDSMGIVELLTEIEDEFGIEIPFSDFDLSDFDTTNKIINYVVKNIWLQG